MTKHLMLFLLMFYSLTVTYGQSLGDYYVPISMDSTQSGRLKFLSDTTIEISSIPRHMSPSLKAVYKYTATDTRIEIFTEPIPNQEVHPQGLYISPLALKTKLTLTKIDKGFIDYDKLLIYVRQKDFNANPDIAYIIDGKTYIQDMGRTDGYGLIKKKPKRNKALEKRLKAINKDNSTIEMVRGFDAYKRFGVEKVYGVIVITTKN